MLQQTQVATVIPYFHEFLELFPTVHHLARTDLSKVLSAWEGLGYYSRARHLHEASKIISNHFKGRLPDQLEALLSLPGIGRYTAGAILSIAYHQESPILDGNIKRLLTRLFAIREDPKERKTEKRLWEVSGALIPQGRASSFNQALMELGATVCTPKRPVCVLCPLRAFCEAMGLGNPEAFPKKKAKKKIPHVEAVSAVIRRNGRVLLNRRPLKGLLGGLWEFPNWKVESGKDLKRSLESQLQKEMTVIGKIENPVGTFQHTFSHFKLTLHVFGCRIVSGNPEGKWVPLRKLDLFPMSKLHRTIAEKLGNDIIYKA